MQELSSEPQQCTALWSLELYVLGVPPMWAARALLGGGLWVAGPQSAWLLAAGWWGQVTRQLVAEPWGLGVPGLVLAHQWTEPGSGVHGYRVVVPGSNVGLLVGEAGFQHH